MDNISIGEVINDHDLRELIDTLRSCGKSGPEIKSILVCELHVQETRLNDLTVG